MWELLIENYCRQNKVGKALQVFDDWKAAGDTWMAAQQQHVAHSGDSAGADLSVHSSNGNAAGSGGGGSFDSSISMGSFEEMLAEPAAAAESPRAAQLQQQQGSGHARAGDAAAAAAAAVAPPAPLRYPKLSNVSLAFLEACCRREPDYEWRVFDVCAVMRQQKEQKRQAALARPHKASHHFAPA